MIVSNLMGGGGNQMFQVAASIGAADRHINEWRVSDRFIWKEYVNIPNERYITDYSLPRYNEPHFHFQAIPAGDYELHGYFQSYRYFHHCRDKIKRYFSPRFHLDGVDDNAVAVHIRGGDYLKLPDYHYNLTTDYYREALHTIGAEAVYVFTDDKQHAARVMPNKDYTIFEGGADVHDLFQMSKFSKIIMANSSFSWWAAYLSSADVIAPKKWFGVKKQDYKTDDLYLPTWKLI